MRWNCPELQETAVGDLSLLVYCKGIVAFCPEFGRSAGGQWLNFHWIIPSLLV